MVFAGFLKHIKSWSRYQDLGFADVDTKSLSFHVSLLGDQLILEFLQRFRDDDLVNCIPAVSGTSCTELLGEGFQDRDEQMGAHTRALVNTHFHTELFSQIATNTRSASGFFFINALCEPHQPLLNTKLAENPLDDGSGYMMKCLSQIDKGHVELFL